MAQKSVSWGGRKEPTQKKSFSLLFLNKVKMYLLKPLHPFKGMVNYHVHYDSSAVVNLQMAACLEMDFFKVNNFLIFHGINMCTDNSKYLYFLYNINRFIDKSMFWAPHPEKTTIFHIVSFLSWSLSYVDNFFSLVFSSPDPVGNSFGGCWDTLNCLCKMQPSAAPSSFTDRRPEEVKLSQAFPEYTSPKLKHAGPEKPPAFLLLAENEYLTP